MVIIQKEAIKVTKSKFVKFNGKKYFLFETTGNKEQLKGFEERVNPTITRISNKIFITDETPHFTKNSIVIDNILFSVPFVILDNINRRII